MEKEEIIRLAAKQGEMPDGLDVADSYLFLSMRSLYGYAKAAGAGMDREQGAKEKREILTRYEKLKLWVRIVDEHMRKERDFEGAWIAFAKDPSQETANNLHKAWFRAGLKFRGEPEKENENGGDKES